MTSRRIVSMTSGISAKGMPKDSTTWLRIERVGRVDADREDDERGDHRDEAPEQHGDADVEEAAHDDLAGVGADARGGGAGGEQGDGEGERGEPADLVAEAVVGLLDRFDAGGPGEWNSFAATASIAMLTSPASPAR